MTTNISKPSIFLFSLKKYSLVNVIEKIYIKKKKIFYDEKNIFFSFGLCRHLKKL